ncbi:MAG: hypothetical protein AAGD96_23155 [Chloroflexota bacterium]
MAKKPPSAYRKYGTIKKKRTVRDWVIIGIYVLLAVALVVPLVASLFNSTAGHAGF